MDGSQPLSNPKHERFALLFAQGEVSAAEAYRQEISAKCTLATAETKGPALSRKSQVRVRIEWIKGQVERKAREIADGTVLTMLEKRQFLARVVRAQGAKLDLEKDADLIEGVRIKTGGVQELILPSKIAAVKLDNDLAGDGSEAKGHDAMAELIARLRK